MVKKKLKTKNFFSLNVNHLECLFILGKNRKICEIFFVGKYKFIYVFIYTLVIKFNIILTIYQQIYGNPKYGLIV